MSTWIVDSVTEKPGLIVAELHEVEWFKENPEWTEMMIEYDAIVDTGVETAEVDAAINERYPDAPEQFIEARPDEEGADSIEGTGRMTLDITEGPEIHPLDNVELNVSLLVPVDA